MAQAVLIRSSIALSPQSRGAALVYTAPLLAPSTVALPARPALRWDQHPCGALILALTPSASHAHVCAGSANPSLSHPQLYKLDEDPKRKEFLDDLFGFMQKRGTPVNRIPIMAKQVLDLYMLYQLVTDKGGLVEVINKKIWREITKGLNLPTSITSAAFTLRTQYMKYLYPYECEKQALSSPGELQAAIDSNRREGRRQAFGMALFNYSPASTPTLLGYPKIPLPALSISTHSCSQLSQVHTVKKGGHHLALREKLEVGEPPEKKAALTAEEQQRLVQHALQHNLLAVASQFPMNIKISNRGSGMQLPSLGHPIPWHPRRELLWPERSRTAQRGQGPTSLSWAGSCFCFS
uniref:AT-rich interactive domain-containing protein 3 n=1 Tax=Buteo japonicus TaxID=224669 RepID=A0A8C0HRT9_9AVES